MLGDGLGAGESSGSLWGGLVRKDRLEGDHPPAGGGECEVGGVGDRRGSGRPLVGDRGALDKNDEPGLRGPVRWRKLQGGDRPDGPGRFREATRKRRRER